MSQIIRGSSPRTFPVGAFPCLNTLRRVFAGPGYKNQIFTVPDGEVLVIPEHGEQSPQEVRREFPAGTRFTVIDCGSPRDCAVTEVHID